ncbi:uncharacterized protein SOCE26_051060 [Sorangium cellulosum]|uniref:Phage resistance protein n=1 Tax=Sorangium cellulosum TaxID=56 RepID=A0A2L0EWH8_SORCE|nr:hypothetical protein [Sorangium cellulosum]AUX43654.1 uncharacterized protein SOCE26_051060 [Sorangium cellulosum]
MSEAPLRRYFQIPEDVKTVDFVHQIDRTASTERNEAVLGAYVVTPSIARNLERALDNVRRGLGDRRSVFTWVHGSFGSGKSHFMNVLSLLLADDMAVYSVHPELQAHRKKFSPGVIGKKLFRLHVQCISRGATTLEEIVFGAAVEELSRLHPGAPAPALFESQKLFESARRLLDDLGDAKFFRAFPSNQGAAEAGEWGDIGGWDRARFERVIAAPQSKEARDLAGELAKTPWFEGVVASSAFVKLGPGLQILAEHLQGLGYEGVVLFLDELVLWLSAFQDPKKLALETPKVSTLVEHGDYPPALPFLTFAARQRDLSEMVGKLAVGRDEVVFKDQLSFWKDRFETISLEDKDLPRIIEKRVLRTTGPHAKTELDAAFETYKRTFAQDFRQLNGNQGDADDFRRVYPFTPALVEVMVALSATLQRDRTALRELTHLLVRYLPDFELGKVVPVGDLFDVVAHGQTSDLPAIQRLYEQARRIYEGDLLPHIRKKNKTDTPERCQLLREDFDARLGCAGCAEKACRNQTRIAKTVLLQGIVPNTPVLKNLTAASLVYLNSGTLKSKVPNQETAMATTLVREWASVTPAVHAKGEGNPEVRGVLDTVDVRRILDYCRDLGNEHRRRVRVRDILFERMGVARKDQMGTRSHEWRGRKWRVGFVYDNTRLANDNVFRPGEDEDLRVVIDYPFDEMGYSPRDDEQRVMQLIEGLSDKDAARGLPTVVWLPAFLNEDTRQALADLATLDGLYELRGDHDLASRIPWVSMDELGRVRSTLEQQRELKRAQVENALASAYGVDHAFDALLASGLAPERQVHLLRRDTKLTVPADGLFDKALKVVLDQALETRAPRHPVFGKQPTKARLEAVLELLDRLLDTPDRKAKFDKAQSEELRAIAAAEHLGIVRIIEEDVSYAGGILDQVTRNLANHKGPLSVGAVRAALDPDELMELSHEVEHFLVLAYAKAATRPLRLFAHGNPVPGLIGKLTDDTALVPVELPGQQVWQRSLGAAELLGVTLGGKALTPQRVDELAGAVKQKAVSLDTKRLAEAVAALGEWQRMAGVASDVEATQRGEVLRKLHELASAVSATASAKDVVESLARFSWDPARTTAITHMAGPRRVEALRETLRAQNLRAPIEAGRRLEADPARKETVVQVMDRVRGALVRDENVEELRPALEMAAAKITQILVGLPPPPPPPPPEPEPELPVKVTPPPPEPQVASQPRGVSSQIVTPPQETRTTQVMLHEAREVEGLMAELRAKLESGKRIRVTIEILDGEGG